MQAGVEVTPKERPVNVPAERSEGHIVPSLQLRCHDYRHAYLLASTDFQ